MTDTDRVDMWFDPSCTFTCMTSRWLAEVAETRGLDVHWHVMSLAMLNEGQEIPPQYMEAMGRATRALRVLVAAEQRHGPDVLGRLYAALGSRGHTDGRGLTDDVVGEALAEVGADADLAATMEDESWDERVRASHQQGQDAVGDTVGSPVVAIGGRAFFGPVITPIAHGQEGLDLFDGLRLLSRTSAFSELKRARNGPPDFS
jgi:2-hydroxychromene-2-carboxylate isomerase